MTFEAQTNAEVAMELFAERLRELRERRGLTQARLAELLEVSPRVYNRWETGAAAPRLDTVVRIADLLEVSLDELVGRAKPQETEFRIHNPKLHKLYREIDGLSDEAQQALIVVLDSLVKRSRMGQVLAS